MKTNNYITRRGEEFEKEFEKQCCEKVPYPPEIGRILLYWRNWHTNNNNLLPTPLEIETLTKDFLTASMEGLLAELRGKVEGMRKEPKMVQKFEFDGFGNATPTIKEPEFTHEDKIYNQALSDVLKLLE